MPTGDCLTYVSGDGHLGLPMATDTIYRQTHTPPRHRTSGLDWDALKPTCTGCGEKSSQLGPGALCPACRGSSATTSTASTASSVRTAKDDVYLELPTEDLDGRFRGPDTRPEDHSHPAAPAADKAEHLTALSNARIDAGLEAANLDAQCAHATQVLRNTANSQDPGTRLLRLNVLASLEALHLFHELNHHQTPAVHVPAAAGPRPAAREEGKPPRQPATRGRTSKFQPHRDEIIARYTAGESARQIAETYGATGEGIAYFLRRNDIPLRPRGTHHRPTRETAR